MRPEPQPLQPDSPPESPIAVATLVTGTLSLAGFGFLTGIPAIILAFIGLKKKAAGRRFLIGGLVTGLLGTLLSLLVLAFFFWIIGLEDTYPSAPYPTPGQQPFESTQT